MKHRFFLRVVVVLALALGLHSVARADESIEFGRPGKVMLYRPAGREPAGVVLFLSGDGGWTPAVARIAGRLAERGMLVAGIDTNVFRENLLRSDEACTFSAGDLEPFAHFLESELQFSRYVNPVVVGFGQGATLAYATLVQAPAGTFKGAVSVGFCPDLAWSRPMCGGLGPGLQSATLAQGRQALRPAPQLQDPWIAIQGERNELCSVDVIQKFAAAIPGAEVVVLPGVGPEANVEGNDPEAFVAAVERLATDRPLAPLTKGSRPSSVADLPLVEVPAIGKPRDQFAIMLSGDGGWAGLDRAVAAVLAANGMPVVGWDSLRYFWKPRTPEGAARDLARIIDYYALAWRKSHVMVIGYSMGADALPFIVNRLPAQARQRVTRIGLLAPGTQAFFEFHVGLWLGRATGGVPIVPELAQLPASQVLCVFGSEETQSLCQQAAASAVQHVGLPGDHHFGGAYDRAGNLLLDFAAR